MSRDVYDSVDDAVFAVARLDTRGLRTIAAEMSRGGEAPITEAQLREATDPYRKPRFPAAWLCRLTMATGNYAAIRTICRQVGGVFYALPTDQTAAPAVVAALGEVLREVGEDAALLGASLADGVLEPREAQAAIDELDQTVARIGVLRAALVHVAAEARPLRVVR